MENAGAEETPNDAERKGLGTPATRAGIIEKLVKTGQIERKKGKKSCVLLPTQKGVSLITVLPEELQSPLLTAEWEHKLKQIEKGEVDMLGTDHCSFNMKDQKTRGKDDFTRIPDGLRGCPVAEYGKVHTE